MQEDNPDSTTSAKLLLGHSGSPPSALNPYALRCFRSTLFSDCPNRRVFYPSVRTFKVTPECPKGGVNDNGKVVHALRTAWNQVYPSLRTVRVTPECPNSGVFYPAVRAVW
jgi:hypothetical protein